MARRPPDPGTGLRWAERGPAADAMAGCGLGALVLLAVTAGIGPAMIALGVCALVGAVVLLAPRRASRPEPRRRSAARHLVTGGLALTAGGWLLVGVLPADDPVRATAAESGAVPRPAGGSTGERVPGGAPGDRAADPSLVGTTSDDDADPAADGAPTEGPVVAPPLPTWAPLPDADRPRPVTGSPGPGTGTGGREVPGAPTAPGTTAPASTGPGAPGSDGRVPPTAPDAGPGSGPAAPVPAPPVTEAPVTAPPVTGPPAEEPVPEEPPISSPPTEEPTISPPPAEDPAPEEPPISSPPTEESTVSPPPAEDPAPEEPPMSSPPTEEPTSTTAAPSSEPAPAPAPLPPPEEVEGGEAGPGWEDLVDSFFDG
ncbi:hypothetical protein [Modestobacter sp. SYSU DS0875]